MKKVYCKNCKWMFQNSYKFYCYHPSNFQFKSLDDPVHGLIHEKTFKMILCHEKNKNYNCLDYTAKWWRKLICEIL
jgi:hypothetical protein